MSDTIVTSAKWQEIRSLAEQGVDYTTLSERYGVSYSSIGVRSHKEGWFTPERVKIKLNRLSNNMVNGAKNTPSDTPLHEKRDEILAETWQQKAENLRILSFETAVDAIKRAKGLIAIETASDLKAAVHVARQATGVLDTEAPAISLNLGGSGGFFAQAGPVYEATEPEPIGEPEGPPTLEGCGI
jgi:hypothetical protein